MERYVNPTPETVRTFICTLLDKVTYKPIMDPETRTYTISSEQGNHFLASERFLTMRADGLYRNEIMNRRETDAALDTLLCKYDWTVGVSLVMEKTHE